MTGFTVVIVSGVVRRCCSGCCNDCCVAIGLLAGVVSGVLCGAAIGVTGALSGAVVVVVTGGVCGRRCYRADEAGVVPGVAQRLDELVAGLHGEVAAMTFGAEEGDVIWWADRKLGVDL